MAFVRTTIEDVARACNHEREADAALPSPHAASTPAVASGPTGIGTVTKSFGRFTGL
jgi:hypothetical protein